MIAIIAKAALVLVSFYGARLARLVQITLSGPMVPPEQTDLDAYIDRWAT